MTEIRADLKHHAGERSLGEGGFDSEYEQDAEGAWVWNGNSIAYLSVEDRADIDEDGLPAEVAADLRAAAKAAAPKKSKARP